MSFEPHPSFSEPGDSDRVWRYLSLSKFLGLITTATLWFTRADLLGDPHEGSLPRLNAEAREAGLRELLKSSNDYPPAVREMLTSRALSGERQWRQLCHVSSWHLNAHEASWMWKSYVPSSEGVAIRTDWKDLKPGLTDPVRQVRGGLVRYLDYDSEGFEFGNAFDLVLTKRKEFEGERELRLMVLETPSSSVQTSSSLTLQRDGTVVNDRGEQPKSWVPTLPPGMAVAVDLGKIVSEIRLAPGAGSWMEESVGNLTRKYGLDVPISRSSIDAAPRI